jgi:predicted TIM-barrel fold metal-dependent hydrolase
MMIIDSHVHIGREVKIYKNFYLADYLKFMKDNHIDKSVIMPVPISVEKINFLNENLVNSVLSLPEKVKKNLAIVGLIGSGGVRINEILNHIRGFKYHPSISQIPINNNELYRFFLLAEKNFPIIVHCGRDSISHITHLIDIASKFEHVNFVAAHLGGQASDLIYESINLFKKATLKNIYADTSGCYDPQLIRMAVDVLGDDRILFGSDEPYLNMNMGLYCLKLAKLSRTSMKKVLSENAERLFFKRSE